MKIPDTELDLWLHEFVQSKEYVPLDEAALRADDAVRILRSRSLHHEKQVTLPEDRSERTGE